MQIYDDDRQDDDVPALAVKALAAAQRRARLAGHARVLVRDGQLIRVEGDAVTILKRIPARKKVQFRAPRPDR
jgi:hypothetical protein